MNNKVNYGNMGVNYAKQALQQDKNVRLAVLLVVVIAIGGGAVYGYRTYAASKERAAQLDLGESLREYGNAQVRDALWPDVQELFKAGYERNKNSDLAPYFKLFEANALVEQDKKEEAIQLIDDALKSMKSSSPLYTLYATKRALIAIDLGKEEGLEQLKTLGYDENNKQRDVALYYLGLYYWSNNDIDGARQVWETLVSLKKADPKATSEWMNMADKKLEQIV